MVDQSEYSPSDYPLSHHHHHSQHHQMPVPIRRRNSSHSIASPPAATTNAFIPATSPSRQPCPTSIHHDHEYLPTSPHFYPVASTSYLPKLAYLSAPSASTTASAKLDHHYRPPNKQSRYHLNQSTPIRSQYPSSATTSTPQQPSQAYSLSNTLLAPEPYDPVSVSVSVSVPLSRNVPPTQPCPIPSTIATTTRTSTSYAHASTTPIIYLCRPLTLPKFLPLKQHFSSHFELRYLSSLKYLQDDLRASSLLHPDLIKNRKKIWVCAVGGTDAFVRRIKDELHVQDGGLEWREVRDAQELMRELEDAVKALEREQVELGYRRIIEQRQGLNESGRTELEEEEEEDVKPDLSQLEEGWEEEGDEEEEERALYGAEYDYDSRSRKRSRDEEEQQEQIPPIGTSRIDYLCLKPRKKAVERARESGLAIDSLTQKVDSELQLGEWDHGQWTLFDETLLPLEAPIQVLIARALRDAAYPAHLRLYDHRAALEQLEASVPWFTKLLRLIESRTQTLSENQRSTSDTSPTTTATTSNHNANLR